MINSDGGMKMELDKVMAEKFSARDYKDIVIEDEKLDAILEAGRFEKTKAMLQRCW